MSLLDDHEIDEMIVWAKGDLVFVVEKDRIHIAAQQSKSSLPKERHF